MRNNGKNYAVRSKSGEMLNDVLDRLTSSSQILKDLETEQNGVEIKTITKDNFINTIDVLIKSKSQVIEHISDFLFSDFLNDDRVSKDDQGNVFRVKRKGQEVMEFIDVSELNDVYLLKAQAELLQLKKELSEESKNNA
jgi:hypothetical protein